MKFDDYKKLAMRTNDRKCSERLHNKLIETKDIDIGGMMNACLGLSGEVGELNDMIKKWIFHEHSLNIDDVQKEVGDILWYIAMMCDSFGFSMDKIADMNIEKLMKRYPDGFSALASKNREEYKVDGLKSIIDYQERLKTEQDSEE